jgi:hypothetical protein
MKKTIQKKRKEEKEVVEVMPVATQYNNKDITISYYTRDGKEISEYCIGKEYIIKNFLTAN